MQRSSQVSKPFVICMLVALLTGCNPSSSSENTSPTSTGIPDIAVDEGSGDRTLDLATFFADKEDASNTLLYSIQSNLDARVVVPTLSGRTLKLVFSSIGNSIVTLKATDTGGLSTTTNFKVAVKPLTNLPALVEGSPPRLRGIQVSEFENIFDPSWYGWAAVKKLPMRGANIVRLNISPYDHTVAVLPGKSLKERLVKSIDQTWGNAIEWFLQHNVYVLLTLSLEAVRNPTRT